MARRLHRGRRAFARQAWATAYTELTAADREALLDLDDVERLAAAAFLIGRADDSAELWARAHRGWLERDDVLRGARCVFWLAFGRLNGGDLAQGGGWTARGRRLLEAAPGDCVEHGYFVYLDGLHEVFNGDIAAAAARWREAVAIGQRCGDDLLVVLASVGLGRCLIYDGDTAAAMRLLDEAMVPVEAREVPPVVIGDVCCTVIEGCQEVFDVARAREWTAALSHWCNEQPQLVLYRGQCLIHRAELMVLRGDWDDAVTEAERACARLAEPAPQPALGAASYVLAEVHRLRGEVEAAEHAYREASRWGRDPQPGLALLRMAQGQVPAASAAIRRVLDEAHGPVERAPVLAAAVEIALTAGELTAAKAASAELESLAGAWESSLLHAQADRCAGQVLLASGDARGAVSVLRRAWSTWMRLEARYEAGRTRVLLAQAERALGDDDGASIELDAARTVFDQLGAVHDRRQVDELLGAVPPPAAGLTPRELEVLALVATGRSNRAIAAELVISERTVASHVGSILAKLGLPSRAAATAYAYQQHLV